MKRAALIGLVVVGLAGLGLVIFVMTFDVDRYRPLVQDRLTQAVGRPVRIQRMTLGWQRGIAAELHGLVIDGDGQPLATVERAQAVLRLGPLLRRQAQIASVQLDRPRAHLIREADGRLTLAGAAVAVPAAAPLQHPSGSVVPPVTIEWLGIRDGEVRWTDRMAAPPRELAARGLSVTVRHLGLDRPIEFRVAFALLSREQNIDLSGRLRWPSDGRAPTVESVFLETRLEQLDLQQVIALLPSLQLADPLQGRLTVAIDRMTLDATALQSLEGTAKLVGGRITRTIGPMSQLDRLSFDMRMEQGRCEFTQLMGKTMGGEVQISSAMDLLKQPPTLQAAIDLRDVRMDMLMDAQTPGAPQLQGRLSASFRLAGAGATPAHLLQTLSGSGRASWTAAVIQRWNLLHEVFSRLSVIPGLVERLETRLPPETAEKLREQDTVFKPVEWNVTVDRGVCAFRDVTLASDTFELGTSGEIRLSSGSAVLQSILRVEPVLSGAVVRSVNELETLLDAQGRLELPVVIEATAPSRLSVVPDLHYVASRILSAKAEQWLGDVLNRALRPQAEPAPEAVEQPPAR